LEILLFWGNVQLEKVERQRKRQKAQKTPEKTQQNIQPKEQKYNPDGDASEETR